MNIPEEIVLKQEVARLREEVAEARLYINTHLNRYTGHISEQYEAIHSLAPYLRGIMRKVLPGVSFSRPKAGAPPGDSRKDENS